MQIKNPYLQKKRELLKRLDKLKFEYNSITDRRTSRAKEIKDKMDKTQEKYNEINRQSKEFIEKKLKNI